MSARDRLYTAIEEPGTYDDPRDIHDLIDDFAHELAAQHAAMLRAYPDYQGVMDLAAALVLGEDHPHRKHDHPAPAGQSEEKST